MEFMEAWGGGVPELNVRVHISLKNGSPFSQNPSEEFSALDLWFQKWICENLNIIFENLDIFFIDINVEINGDIICQTSV